eukprot:jgi/Astpho2/6223/Aster-03630
MIVCVAVVGQKNNPLFIEVFSKQEALPFHYIVHCALDAVEEKGEGFMCSLHRSTLACLTHGAMLPAVTAPRKGPSDLIDAYLGLLYPTEDYKVYGYISNTRIKFLLVLNEQASREDEIRLIFQRFHAAYVDAISDPFYTMDTVSHRHC